MVHLQESSDDFAKPDVRLLGIVGQKLEKIRLYLARFPLNFRLCADADRSTIKAYGVYHRIGLDAWRVSRPAVFLIDRQGIIRYIFVGANQRERPSVEMLLETVAAHASSV